VNQPGRVRAEFKIVAADGLVVLLEAASFIPLQALLVLSPDMRRDRGHIETRIRHGRRNDVIHSGIDQPQRPVRRQEAKGLDVEVLGHLAMGLGVENRLDATDDSADHLGLSAVMRPCDDAREAAGGGGINCALIEVVRVTDG
jgi:hypothetical protein